MAAGPQESGLFTATRPRHEEKDVATEATEITETDEAPLEDHGPIFVFPCLLIIDH